MGQLQDRMAADLAIAGYSPSTQRIYLLYARRFVRYYRRSPAEMGADEVRYYLLNLIEHHQAARGTVRQVRSALRFLYAVTLKRPIEVDWLPTARRSRWLPVVLSGSEVTALLNAVRIPTYRLVLMTMYAAGLRVGEACRLLPEAIDSKRMLIHVRRGKGDADRYTRLSTRLLGELRTYWRTERPAINGYLFPAKTRLGHANPDTVRLAFRHALTDAGIEKNVTPHVLRHCFTTHLLESGVDVMTVKTLLGHVSVRTTERYAHISIDHAVRSRSPLDLLGTPEGRVLG